jgi:hypothetical protein
MSKQTVHWLVPLLLAFGAAGALWYYWIAVNRVGPAPVVAPQPAIKEPRATLEPAHPLPDPDRRSGDRPKLVPLPPLDQSDDYFKLALGDLFGEAIEEMLAESGVIERIVATVDNLPRTHVAERIRPFGRLGESFVVDGQDGDGEFTLSPVNYDRYDTMVDLLAGADLEKVAELYRRFYPLFQSAYMNLGYPDGYFNDRLVDVIDNLLATPDIDEPVRLVRPHVLYEFADPELEGLSAGQKSLLRMGSEHRSRIKAMLGDFRNIVTRM